MKLPWRRHDSPDVTEQRTDEVLIFVDIDGVLNVGLRDGEAHPIQINEKNLERLEKMKPLAQDSDTTRLMKSVYSRQAEGDDATYADLCRDAQEVAPVFVRRLANIIQAAGHQRKVVLTSTWRLPPHAKRLQGLEAALSQSLGSRFVFDCRTPQAEERTPGGRLASIGKFLAEYRATKGSVLRVLVLEDFHIHPFGIWACEGRNMSCVADAENYMKECIPRHVQSAVRLIHTYDEWKTRDGLAVYVGAGLTQKHFSNALLFLNEMRSSWDDADEFDDDINNDAARSWARSATEPAPVTSCFARGCTDGKWKPALVECASGENDADDLPPPMSNEGRAKASDAAADHTTAYAAESAPAAPAAKKGVFGWLMGQ